MYSVKVGAAVLANPAGPVRQCRRDVQTQWTHPPQEHTLSVRGLRRVEAFFPCLVTAVKDVLTRNGRIPSQNTRRSCFPFAVYTSCLNARPKHTHTHARTHTHTLTHTRTHTHSHTLAHTHTHTHSHARTHKHTHTLFPSAAKGALRSEAARGRPS